MFYNPPGFQVGSPFGKRRGIDRGKPHGGLDLTAPAGTSVPAALTGKVVFSGVKQGYGYTVIIQDAAGNYELYGHLAKDGRPPVDPNRTINAGDQIGTVGSLALNLSLNAIIDGEHLHFEIIQAGHLATTSREIQYRADPLTYDPNNPVFGVAAPPALTSAPVLVHSNNQNVKALSAINVNNPPWEYSLEDEGKLVYRNPSTGEIVKVGDVSDSLPDYNAKTSTTERLVYELYDANGTFKGSRIDTGNFDRASGKFTPLQSDFFDQNKKFITTRKFSSLDIADPVQFVETDPAGDNIQLTSVGKTEIVALGGVKISLQGEEADLYFDQTGKINANDVEAISLGSGGNNNIVSMQAPTEQGAHGNRISVDLGATLYSSNDVLAFTQYEKAVYLGSYTSSDGSGGSIGLFNNKGTTSFAGYDFSGVTTLILGAGDDEINLSEAADPYLHTISTGGGKNTITSGNINVTINLQGSSDTVLRAGRGSTINVDGQTRATIELSDDVLVKGLKGTDTITVAGKVLHGAIGSANSESGWVTSGDGVYYGLTADGQLEIKYGNNIMTVDGYNGGPGVPLSQQTGGIFIGVAQTYAWQVFKASRPSIGKADTDFKAANDKLFTLGLPPIFNADPLVLDLTGNGINLTAVASDAPMIDVNADGFLVHTGWVGANTGILVDDKNGNGLVDNAGEMFGGSGVNGFAALAQYDTNGDGVIDANDAIFGEFKVWRDLNGNGVVDAGEMESLGDAGIASINLSATAQTGVTNAGNTVLSTGTFTRTDGTTSAIDDVNFNTDPFHSVFAGDTSISAAAAVMPNIKGYGTLTDLQVAMTLDPGLIDIVNANLLNLATPNIDQLRAAALPIFTAWAAAVPLRDADGNWHTATPAAHPGIAYLSPNDSPDTISDFAYEVSDSSGTYWKLASGQDVLSSSSTVISRPTLDDVLNEPELNAQWKLLSGDEIAFMERYRGVPLPLDAAPTNPQAMISAMSDFISASITALNLEAVRLAMQGPLAPHFQGLSYDIVADKFHATTDQQLTPMFEQIFEHAPSDAAGATAWIASWQQLLDIVLGDLDRGALNVTYAYMFASMVRAYEAVNLPISITAAASALGVPADEIVEGGSVITGQTNMAAIYYLHGGDQTVNTSSLMPDNFVMGGTFGHVVINADRGGSGDDDILRFTNVRSTDVTAYRDGLDLILNVNGTDEQIRLTGEFVGIKPGLIGGNLNDKMGVQQIAFSDGVVWDKSDISRAVAHPQAGVTTLVGTPDDDTLDPGAGGGVTMTGGDGGDTYIFGRGYGHDVVDDEQTWILNDNPDTVEFKAGITFDDLQFSRDGASNDLNIPIKGTDDELTIHGEFDVGYNAFNLYLNRVELFEFSDGSFLTYADVVKLLDQQSYGKPAIYGFSYDDTLDGGPGVHWLSGGNESDTYEFDFGYNYDVVEDGLSNIVSNMNDTIEFGASVRPQDVTFSLLEGTKDLVITLSDGSTMVVKNEFSIDIWGISFDRIENFQFADGTVITFDQLRQQLSNAQEAAGNAVVLGTDFPDTIDVGAGNQYLAGGSNDDTYVFGHGYGHDTIDDMGGTVSFKSDVSVDDVEWSKLGNDLVIKLKGSNDSLTILGEFGGIYGDYSISTFQFADGTTLSRDDIYARLRQGGAGNDSFDTMLPDTNTGLGHPPIEGGAGDDVIIGAGGDTIKFNLGDGRDVVADPQYYYGGQNTIDFGAAITPDMVQVHQLGTSMIFTFTGANDRIAYVDNQGLGFPLANIVFADGTTWTSSDIQSRMQAGVSLTGSQVSGGIEYDYNLSQGYAVAAPSTGQAGTISIHVSGLLPGDVDLQRVRFPDTPLNQGAGLLISAKDSTSGGLLIDNPSANLLPFDQLVFDDGTIWTRAQVQQMLIDQAAASTGNQIIYGFDSDDTITSGVGDDVLEGGKGNDTYVYRRGDGSDKIVVNNPADYSHVNVLSLPDIASTEVSLLRWPGNGLNDLVLAIDGQNGSSQGQITIAGEFNYGSTNAFNTHVNRADAPIQQIVFADGVVWSEADIEAKLLAQEQAQVAAGGAIYGFDGSDTLFAEAGAHMLVGGLGDDTYVWTSGEGPTFIADQGSVALSLGIETNTLDIKGVAAADVTVTRNPDPSAHDLILTISGQAPIVLKDQTAASTTNVINRVVFDDGTVWDWSDLLQRADGGVPTTPDGITARAFDGSAASLTGTASDDTYFWGAGLGDGTIVEGNYQPWQKADTVRLAGLNAADVDLGIRQENSHLDLIIIDRATGEALTVVGQLDSAPTDGSNSWPGGGTGIERLIFADGTTWNTRQILDHAMYVAVPGGTTVSNLNLGDGSIPIGASPGVTLVGKYGTANTYLWRAGDGNVNIQNLGWDGPPDTLRLEGVAAANLQFEYSAGDLVIRDQATDETITALGQLPDYGSGKGIERISLDDGTVLDLAQTIYFGRGSGTTNLNLYGSVGKIAFGAGISARDVYLQANESGDLTVKIKGDTDDAINLHYDLRHQSWGYSSVIQQLQFDDGTVLSLGQSAPGQGAPLTFTWFGSASVTSLTGCTLGANVYEVAPGGDRITFANSGYDNLVDFLQGDGHADVSLNGGTGSVNLDVLPTDISLSTNGNDLIISLDSGDDTLTIHDYLPSGNGITAIHFADGTVWDSATVKYTAIGTLLGTGDTSVNGDGRAHYYIYTTLGGNDVINDPRNVSALVMQDIASSGVTLSRDHGSYDLVLTVTSTGKTVTLKDEFSPYNTGLGITFSDGVSWITDQIEQRLLDQQSTANGGSVYGYDGRNDTLVAGLGDKYLNGQGGADTYIYTSAGGNDVIDDDSGTLVMQDIASTDVTLSRNLDSWDLMLTVTSTGKTVTVKNDFSPYVNGFGVTSFSDGVSWTRDQIEQKLLDQASGMNGGSIYGFDNRNDTLVAGLGDKYLNGKGGADTYVYTSAGGNDVIDDDSGTLVMQDIASTGVTLSRNGSSYDVTLTVNSTGKTVTLKNEFSPYLNGISVGSFSDGVSWTRDQIEQKLLDQESATTGGSIYGFDGRSDTLVAGLGDKYLNGEGSADTYIYTSAGGNDVIDDDSGTLVMQDIASTDVTLSRNPNNYDVTLTVSATGKTVLLKNETFPWTNGLSINFSDGVSWTKDEAVDAATTYTWAGSPTNLTLTGNAYGTNIFQLGGGAEVANGGARSNIYQASTDTGQAQINLPTATGSQNELDFTGGTSDDQLWFEQSGNNLTVDLLGTSTSVTLANWFSGANSQLQEITAGGMKIDGQISQLVQAMASYTASNPGFDPASSSVTTVPNDPTLQTSMAAAWHA